MRALAIVTVGLLLLAGCSSGGSDSTTTTGPTTTTNAPTTTAGGATTSKAPTTSSGAPTSSSAPAANHAPEAELTADIIDGPAPLSVTFTAEATDSDDDALTYKLVFGDASADGVGDLAGATQIIHSFAAAGTYNVVLNVSDGASFDTATLSITVTTAGMAPIVINAEWPVGASDGAAQFEFLNCAPGPGDGVTHADFTVPAEGFGRPFVAKITGTGPIVEWGLYISDPGCGASDYQTESAEGGADITGTIGPSYSFGYVYSTGGANLSVTITIT